VLRDISKTWSCIMYLAAEITSDRQFAQAFLISEELANARDLHTPLAAQIPGLTDVHLKAIYSVGNTHNNWMDLARARTAISLRACLSRQLPLSSSV